MKTILSLAIGAGLVSFISALPHANERRSSNSEVWTNLRSKIKHVVYLIMENRSFDNICGYWDIHPDIDGLIGKTVCNEYTNPNWTVWGEPLNICAGPYEHEVPLVDPDHNFGGVQYQMFRKWYPSDDDVPNMAGFIERQSEEYEATPGDTAFVIQGYSQKETETLATLAQEFAFFDTYFAEHPGPTNPNRQFATSGSTCGFIDGSGQSPGFFNNATKGTTCATSIFEALSKKNISWKNYYETDIIDAWMYQWVKDNAIQNLAHANELYEDIEKGTLPTFSYLNPECCSMDSMHPTSNSAAGQSMIKHLYDSLRNSKYWDNTLLIITYDEHGGFHDHVSPPINVPAPEDGIKIAQTSDGHNYTYDFTRLGVRIPAFLISPYIPANTLIHDQGTSYAKNSAYTHTSVLHFLQELWELEELNNRVQWAKTFETIFQDELRTDTIEKLPTPVWYGGSGQEEPDAFRLLNQDEAYYASCQTEAGCQAGL